MVKKEFAIFINYFEFSARIIPNASLKDKQEAEIYRW